MSLRSSSQRVVTLECMLRLQESGPAKQSQLAEELEIARHTISRLPDRLEHSKYVTRERAGTDKIVRLSHTRQIARQLTYLDPDSGYAFDLVIVTIL